MKQQIVPSLWFEDRCEEAVNFYVSVFANSPRRTGDSRIVTMQRYPEGIENPPWPANMSGKVITAVFELNGQRFMALDGGPHFKPSGAISLLVNCETQEEVDYFWERLTEGGDPKAQQCGWLADKFGFAWQVHPVGMEPLLSSPDRAKANRAMQAMLGMKKIDVAALERAFEGQ
ncbi:MAG TPA: VOC family protein [Vicinamibacterales bacterium]|nr:VOC family protein [Vicinamibacterales bacterium]